MRVNEELIRYINKIIKTQLAQDWTTYMHMLDIDSSDIFTLFYLRNIAKPIS